MKASAGYRISSELFQILKDDAVNLENSAVATGLEKSVFIPFPKKKMPKNVQTTAQLYWFHLLAK